MKKKLFSSQEVLHSLLFLVIAVVFLVMASSFLYSYVNRVLAKMSTIDNEIATLSTKVDTLSEAGASDVTNLVNDLVVALPDRNPSLAASSQIRQFALINNIQIDKMTVSALGTVAGSTLSTVDISFEATGAAADIMTFVAALSKVKPLLNINDVDTKSASSSTSATSGIVTTRVNITSFWAPLPETIPAVSSSVSGFSPAEQELIKTLAGFSAPTIVSNEVFESSGSSELTNPFGI